MSTRDWGNPPLPRLDGVVGHRGRRSIPNGFVTCALLFGTLGALFLEVPDHGHDKDPPALREEEVEGRGTTRRGAVVAYAEPAMDEGSRAELVYEEVPFEGEGTLCGRHEPCWNPLLLWLALAGVAGATIGLMAGAVGLVRGRSRRAGVCVPPAMGRGQVVPEPPSNVPAWF